MTKNTIKYKTLKLLLLCGQIRKKSLNLFIFSQHDTSISHSRSCSSRTMKQLIESGYIEVKNYRIKSTNNHKADTEDVYQLTRKGINLIIEKEDDAEYYRTSAMQALRNFSSRENNNLPIDAIPFETEKIERALSNTDIFALMATCNIPIFRKEKPSLQYLENIISSEKIEPMEGYADNLSKDQCRAILDKGIYYTSTEFYTFAKYISPGIDDTISGCRFKGIFISTESCYVIYTSKKYNNRILRANIKGENGIVSALRIFEKFTDVYRRVPEFDTLNASGKLTSRFKHKPYALFLSDGDVLAYSIATGNPRGKNSNVNLAKQTSSREINYHNKNEGNKVSTYLTAASELYDRMFVIPTTTNGVFTLQYLLSHSLEQWKKDGESLMDADKGTFIKSSNSIQVFDYKVLVNGLSVPVFYMPVIEAKTLYEIANSSQNPIFLTFRDHLNTIARSIRKEGTYYDVDTGRMFDKDEVYIYDWNGNIKGEAILDSYLKQLGFTFTKKIEGIKLPEKFNMKPEAFYNAIARGELKPEEVAEKVDVIKYVKKPKYYKRTVPVTFSVDNPTSKKLKLLAEKENISVSKLVNRVLNSYFQEKKELNLKDERK